MKARKSTEYLIVHCSANVKSTPATVARTHKQRGFSAVGYHFMIDKEGIVYQGRSEQLQGAHCIGRNHDAIGVCLLGHFDLEEVPDAMKEALVELVTSLCAKYPIHTIECHRDYKPSKTCPGENAVPLVRKMDEELRLKTCSTE